MFTVGDIVFYSSTGVCEVVSIGNPGMGLPDHVDYYTLQPLSKNHREMIYVPVDTKAFMRYAMTSKKAREYLDMMDEMKPVYPESRNPKMIQDFYTSLLQTYDCRDLLQVIISLTVKKREVKRKNKNLNQTQTNFLKRAQEMVYNEFAFALGKSSDEIAQLIESKIL